MIVTLLVFILILGLLVFVHELGHFLLAKRSGVLVEEFAFGFKPTLFSKKVGETTYEINLIPLGGYVRMYGEDAQEMGPRSVINQPAWSRFKIFFAGPLANFLLGYLILLILFAVGFVPLFPGVGKDPFVTSTQQIAVQKVSDNSPAAAAGIKIGDKILSVEGQKIATDEEFVQAVADRRGLPTNLAISRQGQISTISITPRENPPAGQGAIGVLITGEGQVRSTIWLAPAAALYESGRIFGLSLAGVGSFAKKLVVKQQVSQDVTGLIGIGALTGVARRLGITYLAQLVMIVSIGLAVVNLLPILPLDGGHIASLIYEKIARKPLTEKQQGYFSMIGLALVLLIFVVVTYRDLVRFDVIHRLLSL